VNVRKRTDQIENLHAKILECIENERYIQSIHAIDQRKARSIELTDAIYVLRTGRHEKNKTRFDDTYKTWHYAIRGNTLEGLDIRVIVAFDEDDMLIITVMHVFKL